MNKDFNNKAKIVSKITRNHHLNHEENIDEQENELLNNEEENIDEQENESLNNEYLENQEEISDTENEKTTNDEKSDKPLLGKEIKSKIKQIIMMNPWIIAVLAILLLLFLLLLFLAGNDGQNCQNYEYIEPKCTSITVTRSNGSVMGTWEIEEYVAGVLLSEVGYISDSEEFLKAQAIAIRSYALGKIGEDCTIESSTRNQVFWAEDRITEAELNRAISEGSVQRDAVDATKGLVIVRNNNIKIAEYDAFACYRKENGDYVLKQGNYGAGDQIVPASYVDSTNKISSAWKACTMAQAHGNGMSQFGGYYLSKYEEYKWETLIHYYYDELDSKIEIRSIFPGGSNCNIGTTIDFGNYQFILGNDGSVNIDNPVPFIYQGKLKLTIGNYNNKNKYLTGSCQSTSFSMILNALGNGNYIYEYFNGQKSTGSDDELENFAAMVWGYAADHGLQHDSSMQGGRSTINSLSKTEQDNLGIVTSKTLYRGTGFVEKIIAYLQDGWLIQYHIPAGSSGGSYLGNRSNGGSSGGHYGLIFGYDAQTNEFIINNNGRSDGENKRINTITHARIIDRVIAVTKSGRMDNKLNEE